MIGWNFPSNGGGQERGIADAGISTFTGKKISSLAREICQNSLDAAIDENSAVTVEFFRHEIYTSEMPAFNEYKKILSKCRDYWKNNDKARDFVDAAIRQLNRTKISVLRISDFNTTGLAEPFNPRAMTGWKTLTKIDGGATKTGDSAGSFGIGKNAPFMNSYLQLVFYRTLNLDGESAAQGMARLVSFRIDSSNVAAGVGYFGETNGNMPVKKIPELDKLFSRDKTGTDIFVYGFNGDKDWADSLFNALHENFLVAIYRDKLRVKIQGHFVNKETLGIAIRKHEESVANNYLKILTGDGDIKIFERDFHGMGTLKLQVLHDQKLNLNRKVLIVRKSGMKLFELDRFSRGISFTAILELEGRRLNIFFRDMETPSHDNWESSRYEKDPKLAQNYLTELKRWVRDTISELGKENSSEEFNVEGLSDMLNFDDAAIDGGNSTQVETLDPSAPQKNSLQKLEPVSDKQKNILTATGGTDNSKTQRTTGKVTDNGTNPAIRNLGGTRQQKSIACDKVRVMKIGDKKYRLIVKVPKNISGGRIEISAVGENDKGKKLFVTRVASFSENIDIQKPARRSGCKNQFRVVGREKLRAGGCRL